MVELLGKRRLVVCLDEVDQLSDFDAPNVFTRYECCLLLISNDHKALVGMDP